MGARVSLSALLCSSGLSGPVRTSLSTVVAAESLFGDVRVSGAYVLTARSIARAFELDRLESTGDLNKFDGFGIRNWLVGAVAVSMPEHNPYRPTIPESVIDTVGPEFYDYQKENQEILREQHNLLQAGDTTFPFELMVAAHTDRQYRLGAISRFYHETYGVILARYVKFSFMQATPAPASPVGLLRQSTGLDWVVTNDLSRSSPQLVAGLLAAYTVPDEGQFGWIIVDGPNLQTLANEVNVSTQGEKFSWSQTGIVSPNAVGRVLGRRVNKPAKPDLGKIEIGDLYVTIESFSKADIAAIIDSEVSELTQLVNDLNDTVQGLLTVADAKKIAAIQKSVTILTSKLNLESGARAGGDKALGLRIDALNAVSAATLSNALTNLTNYIDAENTAQDVQIQAIHALADAAMAAAILVGPATIANLQAQINGLLKSLSLLDARPKGRFPVVDGAVPPNLVYEDDGSLVYTETF